MNWREEVVLHGIRWTNNILTEVVSNHAGALSPRARELLGTACTCLGEAADEIRFGGRPASGMSVKLSVPRGMNRIPLVKAVREVLGVGLREAHDLVVNEAVVEVPDEASRDRLLAAIAAGASPSGVPGGGGDAR